MLSTLTVGQVSAVIAAIVFVVQFLIPNAVSWVLAGVLNDTHSAVTWSVVQRNLVSSHWPLILRTDAVASHAVDRKVKWLTLAKPLGLVLLSLAAVITPIGLRDAVELSPTVQNVKFAYLPDTSSFSLASMSRRGQPFTRYCGQFSVLLPCPSSQTKLDFDYDDFGLITNATLQPGTTYDINVPQELIDLYESGLSMQRPSVASFFDIEHRLFTYTNATMFNNGEKYLVNYFRMMESIILSDIIRPIEGLIVDAISGGVGFRNHTGPLGVSLGAQWSEDILFISPETECVNTNLTLEFTVERDGLESNIENLFLVDEGGFANLIQEYPEVNYNDSQQDAQLSQRAYKAAWLTNVWTALYMNVTRPNPGAFAYLNSERGKRFALDRDMASLAGSTGVVVTPDFWQLVNPDYRNFSLSSDNRTIYSNPFNMGVNNYTMIPTLCQGAGGLDLTNSTNIHVECGLVFGAAQSRDGQDVYVADPYTAWRQPVHVCASALRASIKQVHLQYNASVAHNLNTLTILNVTEREYADVSSMPLWGVENVDFTLAQLTQLWGLISEEKAKSSNITTFRAPYMHLPGFQTPLGAGVPGYQYLPGYMGPNGALTGIYNTEALPYDWTGGQNIAMLQKWRQLSKSSSDAKQILNLIWTDVVSNTLTSSKSWNSQRVQLNKRDGQESSSIPEPLISITVFEHRIRYNWVYAIPALVTLAFAGCLLAVAVMFALAKGTGLEHVRFYLDHLSAGRLLGATQYSGTGNPLAPTKVWIHQVGRYPIVLPQTPFATGQNKVHAQAHKAGAGASISEAYLRNDNDVQLQELNTGSQARQGHRGYMKVAS